MTCQNHRGFTYGRANSPGPYLRGRDQKTRRNQHALRTSTSSVATARPVVVATAADAPSEYWQLGDSTSQAVSSSVSAQASPLPSSATVPSSCVTLQMMKAGGAEMSIWLIMGAWVVVYEYMGRWAYGKMGAYTGVRVSGSMGAV
eukprot:SAG11_NODE_724_length_7524_cov_6.241481_6_plen_145_part_00